MKGRWVSHRCEESKASHKYGYIEGVWRKDQFGRSLLVGLLFSSAAAADIVPTKQQQRGWWWRAVGLRATTMAINGGCRVVIPRRHRHTCRMVTKLRLLNLISSQVNLKTLRWLSKVDSDHFTFVLCVDDLILQHWGKRNMSVCHFISFNKNQISWTDEI